MVVLLQILVVAEVVVIVVLNAGTKNAVALRSIKRKKKAAATVR